MAASLEPARASALVHVAPARAVASASRRIASPAVDAALVSLIPLRAPAAAIRDRDPAVAACDITAAAAAGIRPSAGRQQDGEREPDHALPTSSNQCAHVPPP